MPKPVEVDGLKFVPENFHDFLLEEIDKLKREVCDLKGDFTL